MKAIQSAAELYAHAMAIEREAAERYRELAERMDDEGRGELARVFAELAGMEAEHLATLERRTEGLTLPEIARGQHRWLDNGAPGTAARDLVYRLLTPRRALAIALAAERRAQAFFQSVCWSAADPALRALARGMAEEERGHVDLIARLVEATPESLDSTLVFERR